MTYEFLMRKENMSLMAAAERKTIFVGSNVGGTEGTNTAATDSPICAHDGSGTMIHLSAGSLDRRRFFCRRFFEFCRETNRRLYRRDWRLPYSKARTALPEARYIAGAHYIYVAV